MEEWAGNQEWRGRRARQWDPRSGDPGGKGIGYGVVCMEGFGDGEEFFWGVYCFKICIMCGGTRGGGRVERV